jgi:sugar lactone lactonase YvrE
MRNDKNTASLTLVDPAGKQTFRVSGFRNSESMGSSRMIAVDRARKCTWVIENSAHRLRRFDFTGKVTLTINGVQSSAIAVDAETGNLWALGELPTGELDKRQIGHGRTVVFDDKGRVIALHRITGFDIVYDKRAKAFWIADKNLTKVAAAKGEVLFSAAISTWFASSMDIDPRSGAAWVTVRKHPQAVASRNRLLKFGENGRQLLAIELGQKIPFRVSVDPKNGGVWVAHFGKSVERFSSEGKSEAEFAVAALAVQVDAEGYVWVVTPTEVQRLAPNGDVTLRVNHAGKTSQAWMASLE